MDNKKKKGKKKKGNQNKHSGSVSITELVNGTKSNNSVSNAEVLSDNYHGAAPAQNHHSRAPSNADSQSVGVSESDVDQEKLKNLEAKCVELQEEINKQEIQKNIWSQKEGILEERIKLLQNDVDSCIQKEASLEEKINDLQSKNAFLMMREGSLEERIKLLQTEVHSCIKKEVMELKDSRDSLAEENKQLTDSLSALESRIQHVEMVSSFYTSSKIHGEEKSHSKTTEASTKAHTPNEDPSEKESEIHAEPLQLIETSEIPSGEMTIKPSSTPKSSTSDHEEIVNVIEDFSGSMEKLQQMPLLSMDASRTSEDAVSVPLDDVILELNPASENIEAEPVIPLSDAPLIGAPFRLISFVAKFVIGSDLVHQDQPKAER